MAELLEKVNTVRLLREGRTHTTLWEEGLSGVGWKVESFDLKKDEVRLHEAKASLPFVTVVFANSARKSKLDDYLKEVKSASSPAQYVLIVTSDGDVNLRKNTDRVARLREFGSADFMSLPDIETPDRGKLIEANNRLKLLLKTRVRPTRLVPGERKMELPTNPLDLNNDSSQKLDARKIAAFWEIPNLVFAKEILGKNPQTVHKTPDADSLQDALAPLAYIASCLISLGATRETARVWLNSPNPAMRGQTPLHWMKQGRSSEVSAVVHDALAGQPG